MKFRIESYKLRISTYSNFAKKLRSSTKTIWRAFQSRLGMSQFNDTDTLSSRLAHGIFWSVFGAVLSRAVIMGTSVALGRILGASGFGEFGIIQSTMMLFGMSIGAVLSLTITKHTAEFRSIKSNNLGDTISLFLQIGLFFGSICTAAAFVFSPWLATKILGQQSLTVGLQISSILILSGIIYSIQNGVIAGVENFRLLTITLSLRASLALVFQIAGAFQFGLNGAIIGLVLAEVVSTICVQWMLVRFLALRNISLSMGRVNFSDLRLLSNFTVPILIGGIGIQFVSWSNNVLLVNQAEGFQSMGIFLAADKWKQILLFLPSSMSVALLPILTNLWGEKNNPDFKRAFTTNLVVNLLLVLIPSIILMLLSQQIMSVYGPEFHSGWITLFILSISVVFTMLNTVLGQVLISSNMIWRRSLLDILLALGLGLFGWLLIPIYKENGLAIAHVLSYGLVTLILFSMTYRYIGKGMSDGAEG